MNDNEKLSAYVSDSLEDENKVSVAERIVKGICIFRDNCEKFSGKADVADKAAVELIDSLPEKDRKVTLVLLDSQLTKLTNIYRNKANIPAQDFRIPENAALSNGKDITKDDIKYIACKLELLASAICYNVVNREPYKDGEAIEYNSDHTICTAASNIYKFRDNLGFNAAEQCPELAGVTAAACAEVDKSIQELNANSDKDMVTAEIITRIIMLLLTFLASFIFALSATSAITTEFALIGLFILGFTEAVELFLGGILFFLNPALIFALVMTGIGLVYQSFHSIDNDLSKENEYHAFIKKKVAGIITSLKTKFGCAPGNGGGNKSNEDNENKEDDEEQTESYVKTR